ncbi:MAG: methylated-DNA--[protein]-cysteine S-methyltransferase [Flavobacteriales bacterium]|nr:methylated-DNA--[protein]-cysteine S-methyltransferase [Flavobacteriales bacterium]
MRTSIDKRIQGGLNAKYDKGSSEVIEETKVQLNQYFEGKREFFDIPVLLIGSDFQKSVWNELIQIPHGKTDTYLGLSQQLGNEKAIRAVASANGANAISIIVPCHRIIGSDGNLVGYAGGLPVKKKLLELEGALVDNQMDLFSNG